METGLLCLTHRYYDPGTGKFLNRDPIGYQGGANLYGFCAGNPVNESDPDGTDFRDGSDPFAYFNNLFSYATPHDVLHAMKHNDVTHAIKTLFDIYSNFIIPEAGGGVALTRVAVNGVRLARAATVADRAASTAMVLSKEAAFHAGLVQTVAGGPEIVSGFKILGLKGLVGNVYVRNVFSIDAIKKGAVPLSTLVQSLEAEARIAGASKLEIAGQAVINKGFLNPSIARRYGFAYSKAGDTVFLTKTLK